MFRKNPKDPFTSAYKKLINEKNNFFDLEKITDYIKRGADTSTKNKQGHTLLEALLNSCQSKTKALINEDLLEYPETVIQEQISSDITSLLNLTNSVSYLVANNYKIAKHEVKIASKLIISLISVDLMPAQASSNFHSILMAIIDNLNAITTLTPGHKLK